MHNEYFIEKRRLPVEVELVSGEHVGGDLFIQASWRGPSLLEDAPEFMNASEAFFPIQLADGSTRLLAKEHVSVLKAPPSDQPEGAQLYGIPAFSSHSYRPASCERRSARMRSMAVRTRASCRTRSPRMRSPK
jgi:hypothetical protein